MAVGGDSGLSGSLSSELVLTPALYFWINDLTDQASLNFLEVEDISQEAEVFKPGHKMA